MNMQMSWFAYWNNKLKGNTYAFIKYQLCQFMLRYEYFTMFTVKIQFALWVAMETVRFHIAQMNFFFKTFFFLI